MKSQIVFLQCTIHFTSPKRRYPQDDEWRPSDNENLKADAYDLVINGVEIGCGSIRIHDRDLQSKEF